MSEQTDSGGVVSEVDLQALTELFRVFEGLQHPLAPGAKEAKQQFHDLALQIYATKVKPNFQSIEFSDFLTFTRRTCRQRVAADDNYLCP
jgi:hypothetical protein